VDGVVWYRACGCVRVRPGLCAGAAGADPCRDLDHLDDLRDDVERDVRRRLEDL
jgi:hypothetical protein